jgi:hypothetical protein
MAGWQTVSILHSKELILRVDDKEKKDDNLYSQESCLK